MLTAYTAIESSLLKLKTYCEKDNFFGWDPYDGLNSKVFKAFPFKPHLLRLAWIQFFKLSPINFRRLFMVPKTQNPKGLALFLSGYCALNKVYPTKETRCQIENLANRLLELRICDQPSDCWGYDFDWQSRAFFLPANTPNVIVTSFVAQALLDAFEVTSNQLYQNSAASAADFILNDLNRTKGEGNSFCFSYSPKDNSCIFNASLLAAQLLSRVYSFLPREIYRVTAKAAVEYCLKFQNPDGSWYYGQSDNQRWIDSFHTGYNLIALHSYMRFCFDRTTLEPFVRGLDYYLKNFFTDEGLPKYYNNQSYPIDVHSSAQLCVFLAKSAMLENHRQLAENVLLWTINNMQDKQGWFYYHRYPRYVVKIPYMRWDNAWMFYALSLYLESTQI